MGNHRADRRGLSRRPSVTPIPEPTETVPTPAQNMRAGHRAAAPARRHTAPVERQVEVTLGSPDAPGRRRAHKHSASRGQLFRGLPSAPILIGIAALAVSAGGAVQAANPALVGSGLQTGVHQASAMNGTSSSSTTTLLDERRAAVSRDSRRDAMADAASDGLVAAAEAQAEERNALLAQLADKAQAFSNKIARNAWVYPTSPVVLTARFGDYGLWASYHTGLDFNGNTGDPIMAVAGGVVTSVGYDGSYGNKTVITLDDGTEIWYCHQTSFNVSDGQVVRAGELIGTIGSTGNVTGSHLHLEVRPGAGDPVDPYAAMVVHGLFG